MSLSLKKSLGQNFLIDRNIIKLITKEGNINHEDRIIEVGPGDGALTESILEKKPNELIVIEKDDRLVNILKDKFNNKITIINEDMMKIQYEYYLKKNLLIFGNLPYNISTQILAKWIKIRNLEKFCKKLVLMFQKEVADRIIAKPNTKFYGRLSILCNWKMKIEKIVDVEPGSFNPPPKVKSTILSFVPKNNYYELKDPKNLEHVTNIFFSQRRKMVNKPMKILFENFKKASDDLSIDLKERPQNLDYLTYYKICNLYENLID
tara:strand:- start:98 stop:889 length:792 start_codon:yes stop_codon:yes gene_type:complete